MSTDTSVLPVVIGVDGSAGSHQALAWGLRYAARRGAPVRLVHALDPAFSDVMIGGGSLPTLTREREVTATRLLHEQLQQARSIARDLSIQTELASNSAKAALIAESERAEIVVVGSHGVSALSTLLAGSTTMNVATYAHCPVVAVPTQITSGVGIVVGVDGTALSDAALEWAFREAAESGTSLTAVLAWTDPLAPHVMAAGFPLRDETAELLVRARDVLRAALDTLSATYPGVVVHSRVVHDHPVRALTGAAAEAQLLVVGCRGRGSMTSLLLGSVSHGVLHLATCAVAVVPRHE